MVEPQVGPQNNSNSKNIIQKSNKNDQILNSVKQLLKNKVFSGCYVERRLIDVKPVAVYKYVAKIKLITDLILLINLNVQLNIVLKLESNIFFFLMIDFLFVIRRDVIVIDKSEYEFQKILKTANDSLNTHFHGQIVTCITGKENIL